MKKWRAYDKQFMISSNEGLVDKGDGLYPAIYYIEG